MKPQFLCVPGRLPVVPPLFEDELLSSWILRIGAYYQIGEEWIGLLTEGTGLENCAPPLTLCAFDVNPTEIMLRNLARYTGYEPEDLRRQILARAYPTYQLQHFACMPGHDHLPAQSKPGYCPECFTAMEAAPTGMYLRQEWALARRTVCQRHGCPLQPFPHGLWSEGILWRAQGGAVFTSVKPSNGRSPRQAGGDEPIWKHLAYLEEACAAALMGGEPTLFPGTAPASPEQIELFFGDLASIWVEGNAEAAKTRTAWDDPMPFPNVKWRSFFWRDLLVRQNFLAWIATYLYTPVGFHEITARTTTLRELASLRKRVRSWPEAVHPLAIEAIHIHGLYLANEREIREKREREFALRFPHSPKGQAFWRHADFEHIYKVVMEDQYGVTSGISPVATDASAANRPREARSDRHHQMAAAILATNEGGAISRLHGRARARAIGKLAREALDREEVLTVTRC